MSHYSVTFDQILELAENEKMSHLARMTQIKLLCLAEKEKANPEAKRGPGRPRKDDGPKTGNTFQGKDSSEPGDALK
jgi:hypothetical protein